MKPQLIIHTKDKKAPLGDLFGIFFEDLNHAADGGLYAELIQNRSFEFDPIDNRHYHALTAWEKVEHVNGKVNLLIETNNPLNDQNTHYLKVDVIEPGNGVGVQNNGFSMGIPFKKDENYQFSVYARNETGNTNIQVSFESAEGKVYTTKEFKISSTEWNKYELLMTSPVTDHSGRLVITTNDKGIFYLDMVSLFPKNTFNLRQNGLRQDIANLLKDLKPKFMRFPGGCLVHDGSLNPDDRDSMYRWKNTIGSVEKRPARRSNWGYNQTLGLGYYEYFLLCEDLGAKPIPVLPGGYDPHHKRMVPIEELQPWIDDTLDLIEFANGDVTTKWGSVRESLGHPEPFNVEYIGIGNEEVGEPFFERYPYFHKAIKAKYPHIKVINSSGPFTSGSEYDRGWKSARENNSDFVDEHYYTAPEWFLANYHRYDHFKKEDPKVFLGEYASWGNTYYNALVEAAYMTGLEKNAHAVGLACYAPLLCHVDYVNWRPDMIFFNNHKAFGTANYYVQKLFMNHQGTHLLDVDAIDLGNPKEPNIKPINGKVSIQTDGIDGIFTDIRITNLDTGEERNYSDALLEMDQQTQFLDDINWSNYSIKLKAQRTKGHKGFFIYFGENDQNNRIRWEVGGWQNQDSLINAFTNGRSSVLTQSIFSLETSREYDLYLEVKGRFVKTYIDGELINETEDKLPIIEPLYYSASRDEETGDIIIKVINVKDESIKTELILDGVEQEHLKATIFYMSGYSLIDENNFENPEFIKPKEESLTLEKNFIYEFPKQSITVIRLNQSK